ncbi:MAG: hypothetical protein ACFFAO_11660 [Candidatus Hermodarchaeota archaeon]
MLKSIETFLKKQKPDLVVQAPSRINLINPLDAVEGDFWSPAVAINGLKNPLSSYLYIKKINEPSRLKTYSIEKHLNDYIIKLDAEETLSKDIDLIKTKLSSQHKLIYASIYRLYKTNSNFWENFVSQNFEIGLFTTIPRQSGIGGSSSIIISILYGLAKILNLYNNFSSLNKQDFPINRDIIAEMATKVEDEDLKIIAGYGDRYTIARGGIGFCSYYGKLYHKDLSKEPLAVYDRIDEIYRINELPIILCFSGATHESGNVHEVLRKLYLAKDDNIINNFKRLGEIGWKSRFALMKHDWQKLGVCFKKNTEIMNQIMTQAGFKYGIGLANHILIELIEDHPEVYAAKLTGAGGGGSVFSLVNPDKIDEVFLDWQKRLNDIIENEELFIEKFPNYPKEIKAQLKKAEFFKIKINKRGVSILI